MQAPFSSSFSASSSVPFESGYGFYTPLAPRDWAMRQPHDSRSRFSPYPTAESRTGKVHRQFARVTSLLHGHTLRLTAETSLTVSKLKHLDRKLNTVDAHTDAILEPLDTLLTLHKKIAKASKTDSSAPSQDPSPPPPGMYL